MPVTFYDNAISFNRHSASFFLSGKCKTTKPRGTSYTQASHINECKSSIPSCMVHCYLRLAGWGVEKLSTKMENYKTELWQCLKEAFQTAVQCNKFCDMWWRSLAVTITVIFWISVSKGLRLLSEGTTVLTDKNHLGSDLMVKVFYW